MIARKMKLIPICIFAYHFDRLQAYLQEKTSQRTVPNIFINQKHLGGCSDLLDAQKSGKLQQLLK